nr:MAG TPA: hypothetical protein [Caudoviricetes sp.]
MSHHFYPFIIPLVNFANKKNRSPSFLRLQPFI